MRRVSFILGDRQQNSSRSESDGKQENEFGEKISLEQNEETWGIGTTFSAVFAGLVYIPVKVIYPIIKSINESSFFTKKNVYKNYTEDNFPKNKNLRYTYIAENILNIYEKHKDNDTELKKSITTYLQPQGSRNITMQVDIDEIIADLKLPLNEHRKKLESVQTNSKTTHRMTILSLRELRDSWREKEKAKETEEKQSFSESFWSAPFTTDTIEPGPEPIKKDHENKNASEIPSSIVECIKAFCCKEGSRKDK